MAEFDNISKLQSYEDYIANNITEWEAESIASVCRKIGKIGKMSKKELEKFDADKEAKKEWERIVFALAIATALNIRTLKKAYISEFEAWEKRNEYLYRYRGKKPLGVKNGALQGIIDEAVKQNGKDILNLTNTKAISVLDRNGNPIRFQDAIYKSFGDAVKTITEGKADFYDTMRDTVQNLGGGGCRVNYGEGITRRLDTVVRQNIAYGIKQSHKEYNELVGREIGADGIEIDYHANSRPSHRYMQGKQYAKGAEGKTVNGAFYPSAEKEGVYDRLYEDYNCRHYETDIILGVSEPRYSAEEIKRFDEQDKRLYKIGNIEKDGYGWSQAMRAIETDIRKSKDEINALSALGGNEAKIKELKSRIKTFQSKYDEIFDVTGIAKEKRRLTAQKPQNVLTSNTSRGIILSSNYYGDLATPYSQDKVPTKIQDALLKLKKYGDSIEVDVPYKFNEMALMSRQTGVEFASISVNGRNIIIKGNNKGVQISSELLTEIKKYKGILNCHSHPYIGDLQPSASDIELASFMNWQDEFNIITPDMRHCVYNKFGIIQIDNVSLDLTKDEIEKLKEVFGG